MTYGVSRHKIAELLIVFVLLVSLSVMASAALPTIKSFSPSSAYVGESGQTINIKGTGFTGAKSVGLGGRSAKFTVVSDSEINAVLPASAVTYWVSVTTPKGTAYSKSTLIIKAIPAPTIKSFSPTSAYIGEIGQTITINGTNFTGITTTTKPSGVTKVTIGGQSAKFTVVSATKITAKMPASAYTYWITVTTSGGTAYSKDAFIIKPIAPPVVKSFTPASCYLGESGRKITITGKNFKGVGSVVNKFKATSVLIGGSSASFSIINDTTINAVVPKSVQYSTYPISVTNPGGTGYSKDNFVVQPIPTPVISSFSPKSSFAGETGRQITITGTNFKGTGALDGLITMSSVEICGTSARYSVVDDHTVTAIVPDTVLYSMYPIVITTNGGVGYSKDNYVIKPVPAPTITSVKPVTAAPGDEITIMGTGFLGIDKLGKKYTGATLVEIGGSTAKFQVVDDKTIVAVVPKQVLYPIYPVTVTTTGGKAYSSTNFTLGDVHVPVVKSFTPASGMVGDVITISGKYFTDATSVKVGGKAGKFTVQSDTLISVTVPSGAKTGRIVVTTVGGTATSSTDFTLIVAPKSQGGTLVVWGSNSNQLVSGIPAPNGDYVNVSVGASNIAAIRDDGSLEVWGDNSSGLCDIAEPLGPYADVDIGYSDDLAALKSNGEIVLSGRYTNTDLGENKGFVAVSTSPSSLLALKSSGSIVEIDGDNCNVMVPNPNENFIGVCSSYSFRYGLKEDGTIVRWSPGMPRSEAIRCDSGYIALSSGLSHTMALRRDGSIDCFSNELPGLPASQLQAPEPNKDFIAIAAGDGVCMALRKDGSIACWGDGSHTDMYNIPEPNSGYFKISANEFNCAAIRSVSDDNSLPVISQISPNRGKRGDKVYIIGSHLASTTAVKFNGVDAAYTVESDICLSVTVPNAASTGKVSVTNAKGVVLSGSDFYVYEQPSIESFTPNSGHIGENVEITGANFTGVSSVQFNGAEASFTVDNPTTIRTTVPNNASTGVITVTSIGGSCSSSSVYTVVAGRIAGTVDVWGHMRTAAGEQMNVVEAAAGLNHVVALLENGTVSCLGGNQNGQCSVPSAFKTGYSVAADDSASYAIGKNGAVTCWGLNQYNKFGVPKPNQNFVKVSAGYNHVVGLKSDGSIVAWGTNSKGQCTVPTPNSGFIDAIAGNQYSLALRSDGSIVAWGDMSNAAAAVPQPNSEFIAIAAGTNYGAGLKRNGSIITWGSMDDTQLGDNREFVALGSGGTHLLGLKRDGSLVGFGSNAEGKLDIPEPNSGFIYVNGSNANSLAIRRVSSLNGSVVLNDFKGQMSSQRLSAAINNVLSPGVSQSIDVTPESSGAFTLSTYLLPPYDIYLGGSHFLTSKAVNVQAGSVVNFSLTNGDANGDNKVDNADCDFINHLMGHKDPMADLNGDGKVNMLDYAIAEDNNGAVGE